MTVPAAAARAAVSVAARLGVAWDLAATTASPRLDRPRILAAYRDPVDAAQLDTCQQLRRLHLTIWYALYAERLPRCRPRATELLATWRPPGQPP